MCMNFFRFILSYLMKPSGFMICCIRSKHAQDLIFSTTVSKTFFSFFFSVLCCMKSKRKHSRFYFSHHVETLFKILMYNLQSSIGTVSVPSRYFVCSVSLLAAIYGRDTILESVVGFKYFNVKGVVSHGTLATVSCSAMMSIFGLAGICDSVTFLFVWCTYILAF